jgi:hypothetical protein
MSVSAASVGSVMRIELGSLGQDVVHILSSTSMMYFLSDT